MDRERILVVDDERDIRNVLRILLEAEGYRVLEAANGNEALNLVGSNPDIDLIIMDILMPGLSGVEACQRLRKINYAPVLFLTAKSQESDKAAAYRNGGDDYLVKPFSSNELLMKVNSLLRRYRVFQGKGRAPLTETLTLDEGNHRVLKSGAPVDLTDKEWEIFHFMWENRGQELDTKTLYEGAWHEQYLPSATKTVMVHIMNLRKKLEDDPAEPQLIRTVWGKGYLLA